jgi:hypothetical protein
MRQAKETLYLRLIMAALGTVLGFSDYLVFEYLSQVTANPRLFLFVWSFALTLSVSWMLLIGPLRPMRALSYAGALALISASLLVSTSLRFGEFERLFDQPAAWIATFLFVKLSLPFILSKEVEAKGWFHYEGLFHHAWSLTVRWVLSGLFLAVCWGVLWLSAYLLDLVGLRFLRDLLEELWFATSVSGLILGLSLAVFHEMQKVIFTLRRLVILLLRLLLPLIALVTLVFVIRVPIAGLEQAFGSKSAAFLMIAVALGAIILITATVDGSDADAAGARWMTWAARGLALLLPVLAGIAFYAIWLRVAQYGWTPDRVLSAVISLVVVAYSLIYAAAVILRPGLWRLCIRQGNMAIAALILLLSVLWQTPVLNAQRISANNQLARFVAGKTTVEQLSLWEMGKEWGVAGERAVARLAEMTSHPEFAALQARLTSLASSESKWAFLREERQRDRITAAMLLKIVPVVPAARAVDASVFEQLSNNIREKLQKGCGVVLEGGNPACVLVVADFFTDDSGLDAMLFWADPDLRVLEKVVFRNIDTPVTRMNTNFLRRSLAGDKIAQILVALHAGEFRLTPMGLNALRVNEMEFSPIKAK